MAKSYQQLTWISALENRKVCFNQERLPITQRKTVTKDWSDPKVNPEIEKGLNPLASKTNFSWDETMHLINVKFNITHQNN